MVKLGSSADAADVVRLFGLSEAECEAVRAEGEVLVREKLASQVTRHMSLNGTSFVTIRGYWGRHFTIMRDRGDCILLGLYGSVLARNRRFEVVIEALRLYSKAARSAAKP